MIRYAGFPTAVVYKQPATQPGKTVGTTPVQQLLWGDWLQVKSQGANGWVEVNARGEDGFLHESAMQAERLLEVTFVDIGQGDGAIVTMPDDRQVLIDAGEADNMYRFLRWRFGRFVQKLKLDAAVLTHSDMDHYKGLRPLVDEPQIEIGTLYHNGLVERVTADDNDMLGTRITQGGTKFVSGLIATHAQAQALLSDPAKRGSKLYPNLLWDALQSGRVGAIRSLAVGDGHVPGYGPGSPGEVELKVLGPVPEVVNGAPAMRWFGDVGKTKNGHSVSLMAVYRNVSIFLGGDLNIPSERHLLAHHTGLDPEPSPGDEEEALIVAARRVFQCDVAKSCHHGSADFDDLFLRALNPIATVISSGDDEPHGHPRSDTLGAVGKSSRGRRPLIFSTELARSAPERIKHPNLLRQQLAEAAAGTTPAAQARFAALLATLERSDAIYGAINLRTDGHRIVLAQKMENVKPSKKWDVYGLEPDAAGILHYKSKYEE